MMNESYCLHCHSLLEVVGLRDGLAYAFLCSTCNYVWQIGVGWNRWTDQFDQSLLDLPFGYA